MLQITAVISENPHNHPPDETATEAEKVRLHMKDAAKQGRAQPSQIVVDALAAQTVNVRTAVGDLESVKRDCVDKNEAENRLRRRLWLTFS